MIGPTCPDCGWIHLVQNAQPVGSRFRPEGVKGYRSILGGPVRRTREEAQRDWCEKRQQQRAERPREDAQLRLFDALPRKREEEAPKPDPEPFPAVTMETAARAKAWRDFLADAQMSLMVWQLDADVRAACEDVRTWLTGCRDDLNRWVLS